MTGRKRTIWPPYNMAKIEAELGEPVIEWLEREAVRTSVRQARLRLVRETSVDVAETTVKDWWIAAGKRDPGLHQRTAKARDERKAEEARRQREDRTEQTKARIEAEQVRNAKLGKHCPVDGVPLPGNRRNTCSPECAQLWVVARLHLSDEEWEKHRLCVVRRDLRQPKPATPNHDRRVLNGEPVKNHGRWLLSENVQSLLEAVQERREQAKERWGDLAATLPPIKALERGVVKGRQR